MKTTLNKIREHGPCQEGWAELLKHLGKTKADDEPLSIVEILDSNGLDDTLWCLRAVDGYDREIRLYAVWCARQVQHLMTDQRSLTALSVVETYAKGHISHAELNAVANAAWDAAQAAEDAAMALVWAKSDAADLGKVSRNATDVAMAMSQAARAAAHTAARIVANAAWYTARAAADALWDSVRATSDMPEAASRAMAGLAAWDRARSVQEQELRRVCTEIEARET